MCAQARHGQCPSFPSNPLTSLIEPDSLPHRPHFDHRPPEDVCLLRTAAKAQGNRCIRGRNRPHPDPVAFDGVPGRALRDICPLWRLLCNHRVIRRQYSHHWSIHPNGSGEDVHWAEERRVTSLREEESKSKEMEMQVRNIPLIFSQVLVIETTTPLRLGTLDSTTTHRPGHSASAKETSETGFGPAYNPPYPSPPPSPNPLPGHPGNPWAFTSGAVASRS